jgi:hypothetical protein
MGEWWVGVLPPQIFNNRGAHALQILQYLMVPEPEDPVAFISRETASFRFLRRRRIVLAIVRFDDQARVMATKSAMQRPSGT